jgi:hypothetical protein
VRIVDLEASDVRIRSELLSAAVRRGRFPELVTWSVSLSEAEVQLLKSLGFAPVDSEQTSRGCPCVLVCPTRGDLPEGEWVVGDRRLLDMKNWDIRMLYSMQREVRRQCLTRCGRRRLFRSRVRRRPLLVAPS